jgi:hypothetical protein
MRPDIESDTEYSLFCFVETVFAHKELKVIDVHIFGNQNKGCYESFEILENNQKRNALFKDVGRCSVIQFRIWDYGREAVIPPNKPW